MTRQRTKEIGRPGVVHGRLSAVVLDPTPQMFAPHIEIMDRADSTRLIYLDDYSTNVEEYQRAIDQTVIVTVEFQGEGERGAANAAWALDWWWPFVVNNLATTGRAHRAPTSLVTGTGPMVRTAGVAPRNVSACHQAPLKQEGYGLKCTVCHRDLRDDEVVTAEPAPIPMLLWCPLCHERHVDQGEFATKPHKDHSCQRCGLTWRPAKVPTCGVQFLPGYRDEGK